MKGNDALADAQSRRKKGYNPTSEAAQAKLQHALTKIRSMKAMTGKHRTCMRKRKASATAAERLREYSARESEEHDGERTRRKVDHHESMHSTELRIAVRKRQARAKWKRAAHKTHGWSQEEKKRLAAAAAVIKAEGAAARDRITKVKANRHAQVRRKWKEAAHRGVKKHRARMKLHEAQEAALLVSIKGKKKKAKKGKKGKKKLDANTKKVYN